MSRIKSVIDANIRENGKDMGKIRTWVVVAVVAMAVIGLVAAQVAIEYKWDSALARIIAGVHILPLITILVQLGAGAWIGRK